MGADIYIYGRGKVYQGIELIIIDFCRIDLEICRIDLEIGISPS